MSTPRPHRTCLDCGYDLTGSYADQEGAYLCPECGRTNGPADYEMALQHMMSPRGWIATVLLLTGLNIALVVLMLLAGRNPGLAIGTGFFCCLVESMTVCALAGRRAHTVVRFNKTLLLCGALCCFGFVGTMLAIAAVLALHIGRL